MIKKKAEKKINFGLVLTVYLLGIFMGALDTGIVTPARTVIQESLAVDEKTGIWMITIYTLAYAASIPVMGKLADRMGRRTIYLVSIFLFGAGSFLCGLSHSFNSFTMLLICRAIQAIGGGGIVPIATAEFGTTFPEEKRGMALGMVGGVYGIANIFGASAGSLVMDIFGVDKWEFIFYVNVPIAIFILVAGFFALPNTKDKSQLPIDGKGTCLLVVMVLSLMYGLKNIDFFDFINSIAQPEVYISLLVFVALLPIFILVEKKAADPIMNLKYFSNIRIVMTLLVSIITGIVLMGIIFIPQFCENALKVATGSGGYFVIILGVCAGVGAMSSGKLTDKFGPKPVLAFGLLMAIVGSLIIILFSSQTPNKLNVFASLVFIGLGIGFTMGAPLNYMMLGEVDVKESNSALATLSLVRSLGTVVAPAIMVGFISHAGMGMQDALMAAMPTDFDMPELPYAEELSEQMEAQGMEMSMDDMTSMDMDMSKMSGDSDFEMPEELLDELQNSDVTTITTASKHMASYMFDMMIPTVEEKINDGIDSGISGINSGIREMDDAISGMNKGAAGMKQGIDGMAKGIKGQKSGKAALEKKISGMNEGISGIQTGLAQMYSLRDQWTQQKNSASASLVEKQARYVELENKGEDRDEAEQAEFEALPGEIATLGQTIGRLTGMLTEMEGKITEAEQQLSGMQQAVAGMKQGSKQLTASIADTTKKRNNLINQRNSLLAAIQQMRAGQADMRSTINKMTVLKEAVPDAFAEAEKNYLKAIDDNSEKIEDVYQSTLNVGFRQIYIMTAITSAVGLILLALYKKKDDKKQEEAA